MRIEKTNENLGPEAISEKSSKISTEITRENKIVDSIRPERRNQIKKAISCTNSNLCPSSDSHVKSIKSKRIDKDNKSNRNDGENRNVGKVKRSIKSIQLSEKLEALAKIANERSRKNLALPKVAPELSAEESRKSDRKEIKQKSKKNSKLRLRLSSISNKTPDLNSKDVQLPRLEGGLDYNNEGKQGASTSKDGIISNTPMENHTLEKKSRKRDKRGKKKLKNSSKQSELEVLTKYINNIVEEFLLKNETLATVRENLQKFQGNYEDLNEYAAELVKLGLGRIVDNVLRINHKNNRQSFVTISTDRETFERDGMMMLPVARRYAFEGDIVRAFVLNDSSSSENSSEKPENKSELPTKEIEEILTDEITLYESSYSPDSDLDSDQLNLKNQAIAVNSPKAFVIEILKKVNDRKVVGTISFRHTTPLPGHNESLYYKFKPIDTRMPLMYVPESVGALYADCAKSENELTDLFYLARVCETDVNGHCIAELVEKVGKVGHLEDELKAILLHNGFKHVKEYEQRFEDIFANPEIPPLTENEMKYREDLRKKCIFTIDPLTARDLDDAVSIEKISENEFEVGVHIADVSYFLEEGSELDDIVKNRATSIYLVNEVIHMLPINLCYKCSLLPGKDRFAFSVFWRMDRLGNVLGSPRFTRSVINSCTKFAYEHTQKIIENPEDVNPDDFPDIYNGYTLHKIITCVKLLTEMAKNMRRRRFENGALSINNPKLRFDLDPLTGEPISYKIDTQQEANHLIEEFMLLANISVAKHIYSHFPNTSLLRNHELPLMNSLKNLHLKLLKFGIDFDYSSSKAIYLSMQRICDEAINPSAMNACLNTLLIKPMSRAKYICSEDKTEAEMRHYALAVPIYTHFTSPIRRYPDILVHRLLAATLNYSSPPQRTPDELREIAKICNVNKLNAKNASDESTLLYFKRYVKAKQGIKLRAAVLEIHKHLVNVVTIQTGHVLSIHYKEQKVIVDTSDVPTSIQISEKGSKQQPVKLQMFSTVDIKLVIFDGKFTAFFVSPDLKQRQINCIETTKKKPVQ